MATRGDLDRAELENILEARTWAASRTWKPDDLLDSYALADLHHRMFAQVWRWAGKWRSRETSIGIAPEHIQTDLRILVDDARTWTEFSTYRPMRSPSASTTGWSSSTHSRTETVGTPGWRRTSSCGR